MEPARFIVIDDDPVSNMICKLTIEMVLGDKQVQTFTDPEEGFNYVAKHYQESSPNVATLLLDINMPVMTGWEFLERFDDLSEGIKKSISIYILSSSVDPRDKDRSYSSKNVTDHLVKPLTAEVINGWTKGTAGNDN